MTRELFNERVSARFMSSSACVIVPTVNNPRELAVTLECLIEQDYPNLEIIVVGPGDDSGKSVTKKLGLRYIDDRGSKNRADACNVAIDESESDIIFFTDDDVIVEKNWVSKLIKWFERADVAGVGGPNFAPLDDSTFWQKVIDVAFCNKFLTAGTNYGKRGIGGLNEVNQLPGVNSSYRREVLEKVSGFDSGAIGAEDVMLDYRIRKEGYKLWTDGEAIIWHRRRNLPRVRKQIRNYGLVRALAGNRYPELWNNSHLLVSLFPIIVSISFLLFGWGIVNSDNLSIESIILSNGELIINSSLFILQLPVLIVIFNFIAWIGAIYGASPNKNSLTVFMSPLVSFILLWNYGLGIIHARFSLATGSPTAQIDDRDRENIP